MSNRLTPRQKPKPDNLNRRSESAAPILAGLWWSPRFSFTWWVPACPIAPSSIVAVKLLGGFLVGAWPDRRPLCVSNPSYLSGEATSGTCCSAGMTDHRFLPSGPARVKPIQKVKKWVRVQRLIIKHDMQA